MRDVSRKTRFAFYERTFRFLRKVAPAHMDFDGQITVHEAAKLTGWTRQWIYDLCTSNRVRHRKRALGRMTFILIEKQSLLDYFAASRNGAAKKDVDGVAI